MEPTDYQSHGPLSNPGPHGASLPPFPGGAPELARTLQGLLMHDAALALYELEAAAFAQFSRQTLSVDARLDQFRGGGGHLDLSARSPAERMIGTCRDYALLLTGLLRHQGTAARVRCGFAAYFTAGRFDDHWICEVWEDTRWRRVDAQLDDRHLAHYAISFDPMDLPDGQFLTAGEAWQAMRAGKYKASLFNAGAAYSGEWLMAVNLARDCLALRKQETSDWDRWREAPDAARTLSAERLAWADRLAASPGDADLPGKPFWLVGE